MKNKVKYWVGVIGILGILLGRILNRILTDYVGSKASNIIVAVSITIIFCVIVLSIIMSQYSTAIMLFIMVIPLIISGMGLYLNNMDIVGLGILSIFIIYPILIKVISKFKRDRWERK